MADRPVTAQAYQDMGGRPARPRRPYKRLVTRLPAESERGYPFRLLRAGSEQYGRHLPTIRRRVLPEYQLVCVERGHGWFESAGWREALRPGLCVALFPGVPHSFGPHPDDPMEITWLVLEGDALWGLLRQAGLAPERPGVDAGRPPEPRAIFRQLARGRGAYAWHTQALLWSFLARIAVATGAAAALAGGPGEVPLPEVPDAERGGRGPADSPILAAPRVGDQAVERAIELARVHLGEPDLRLEHLARVAYLARSRFSERFRRATGTSPMAYLERLRLDEARRLLAAGALSVGDVARRTGFRDPLYFSKRFHRFAGLSPTAFQRSAAAAEPLPR